MIAMGTVAVVRMRQPVQAPLHAQAAAGVRS